VQAAESSIAEKEKAGDTVVVIVTGTEILVRGTGRDRGRRDEPGRRFDCTAEKQSWT